MGKPVSRLSTARLPRSLDAQELLQFNHITKGRPLPESCKMVCDTVVCIWVLARIPTQLVCKETAKALPELPTSEDSLTTIKRK